jgi:hypothetical protein
MNNNAAAGFAAALLGFVCVLIIISLVITIFFLLTLQKALTRCSPRNRTMEPGMVWLMFIPLFNLFWWFYMVINVGNSLKNEFSDRDNDNGSDYGKTLGIWTMATNLIGSVISNVGQVMMIQGQGAGGGAAPTGGVLALVAVPLSIASLVLFIVYWVKIAGYSKELDEDRGGGRGRDRGYDDDDVDDEPRRPSRPSRPDDRIR